MSGDCNAVLALSVVAGQQGAEGERLWAVTYTV